jgi:CHAD domain-containing protein
MNPPRHLAHEALLRKLRKLGRRPEDHELHQARIRAKQLRYAAEAAAPVIGKPARRSAAAAEALQTVLGEHHDAVGAEAWFQDQAASGSPRQAFRLASSPSSSDHANPTWEANGALRQSR